MHIQFISFFYRGDNLHKKIKIGESKRGVNWNTWTDVTCKAPKISFVS